MTPAMSLLLVVTPLNMQIPTERPFHPQLYVLVLSAVAMQLQQQLTDILFHVCFSLGLQGFLYSFICIGGISTFMWQIPLIKGAWHSISHKGRQVPWDFP